MKRKILKKVVESKIVKYGILCSICILQIVNFIYVGQLNKKLTGEIKEYIDSIHEQINLTLIDIKNDNARQTASIEEELIKLNTNFEKLCGTLINVDTTVSKLQNSELQKIRAVAAEEKNIEEMIQEANDEYNKRYYTKAYLKYKEILALRPDILKVREKYILSLYYSNPLDSSNYQLIKTELDILKMNGALTQETQKVLETIENE